MILLSVPALRCELLGHLAGNGLEIRRTWRCLPIRAQKQALGLTLTRKNLPFLRTFFKETRIRNPKKIG